MHFSTDSSNTVTTTVNGESAVVERSTHLDYVAVGCGALAAICALIGFVRVLRSKVRTGMALRMAMFAGILLIALLDLYRGTQAS